MTIATKFGRLTKEVVPLFARPVAVGGSNLNPGNGWTKWWWVKVHQSLSWCKEERRAAVAFGLAFIGVFLLMGGYGFGLAQAIGFGIKAKMVVSIFLGLLFAILNARGIATEILPLVIREGDDAAAKRLGGAIVLPPQEFFIRRLWWVGWGYSGNWSVEERWTRNAICVSAAVLLLVPLSFEFHVLADLGVGKQASALVFVFVQLPLTFYLSRELCVWLWPDYVKRADDAAIKRSNRNIPPRP